MPSTRAAVAPTVERVLEAADAAGLPHERRVDLAVALAEALSNAAVHGNRLRSRASVRIAVASEPAGAVTVEIEDSGKGFDHSTLDDPTHPERLLATGGRGVFLMRRLVDRLEYNRSGNRVRLVIGRRPHARKR